MRTVYVVSDNIITSLGFTAGENIASFRKGETGIKLHSDERIAPAGFWASMVDSQRLSEEFSDFADPKKFTRFEKLTILSVREALKDSGIGLKGKKTLLILSTTKGNIDLLDNKSGTAFSEDRVYLWKTALILQQFFQLHHTPWVVSNACISGVLAILIGARLTGTGRFDNVIVTGADLVTEFVLSGFNSFLSLCTGPCKPFDIDRQGLSLGEAAGTLILSAYSNEPTGKHTVMVGPGSSSNDANHISGPSRTGEGLYIAIRRTLEGKECISILENRQIGYISAHGTATSYNDEMESIALTRTGLQEVPVNSFKGYWGHTLGAAGVIESIAGIHSLRQNFLFNTMGFNRLGVTHPIAVIDKNQAKDIPAFLKIASGFGGSNAAILFYK